MGKRVYSFGGGTAEGSADMKNLLGGKGAGLAEMSNIGIPVPAGFTITTEVCSEYYKNGKKFPAGLDKEIEAALKKVEKIMGAAFGDQNNPLLVSVHAGASVSMPGMMDSVLNLGFNDKTIKGIIKQTNNERFAWDSYRKFIQMYGDIVTGFKPEFKNVTDPFEEVVKIINHKNSYFTDMDLSINDLRGFVKNFKALIETRCKKAIPDNPYEQLWDVIRAMFGLWHNDRTALYRKMNGFDDSWGTAVTIQAMVFGDMEDKYTAQIDFAEPNIIPGRFSQALPFIYIPPDYLNGVQTIRTIDIKLEEDNRFIIFENEMERTLPSLM